MSTKPTKISDLRKNYTLNELLEENVSESPFDQFHNWFEEAVKGDIYEPNAMSLSTLEGGQPKSRVVLLKGFDKEGFVFYSNYDSHKGIQMTENNKVALLFFWDKLQRQVRVEGEVIKLPESISKAYFNSRPRESQLGAWASKQSEIIENGEVLVKNLAYYTKKFENEKVIPKPQHWGGYCVIPSKIEFWQGRPSRLHDRIVYQLEAGKWNTYRLSP